jgi:hypothetical protein
LEPVLRLCFKQHIKWRYISCLVFGTFEKKSYTMKLFRYNDTNTEDTLDCTPPFFLKKNLDLVFVKLPKNI